MNKITAFLKGLLTKATTLPGVDAVLKAVNESPTVLMAVAAGAFVLGIVTGWIA